MASRVEGFVEVVALVDDLGELRGGGQIEVGQGYSSASTCSKSAAASASSVLSVVALKNRS